MQLQPRSWLHLIWGLQIVFLIAAIVMAWASNSGDAAAYPPLRHNLSRLGIVEEGTAPLLADGGKFPLPRTLDLQGLPLATSTPFLSFDRWVAPPQLFSIHESPSGNMPRSIELTPHLAAKGPVNKLSSVRAPGGFSRVQTKERNG